MKKRVEMLAMNAVMEAEKQLGHTVRDVSAEKCGWDITSITASGETRHIEVKGVNHAIKDLLGRARPAGLA